VQQCVQLPVGGLDQLVRIGVCEVCPERQHPSREGQDHEGVRDRLARKPARSSLTRSRPEADRGRSAYDRPPSRRGRKERVERSPPQIVLRGGPRVERLEDLQLQARLLVEADLQVREQGELGASELGRDPSDTRLALEEAAAQLTPHRRAIAPLVVRLRCRRDLRR
jgi:hypothetical protein